MRIKDSARSLFGFQWNSAVYSIQHQFTKIIRARRFLTLSFSTWVNALLAGNKPNAEDRCRDSLRCIPSRKQSSWRCKKKSVVWEASTGAVLCRQVDIPWWILRRSKWQGDAYRWDSRPCQGPFSNSNNCLIKYNFQQYVYIWYTS